MVKKSIPGALIGIAGVHYVVAELSRRGLVALPTIRNTAAYDIIVATPDGKKHANIQVKTSQNRVNFWPMPPAAKVCSKSNDYYVLVRYLSKEKRFEAFMLKGSEAKREVNADEQRQRKRGREKSIKMQSVHVGGQWAKHEKRWRRKWETWTL